MSTVTMLEYLKRKDDQETKTVIETEEVVLKRTKTIISEDGLLLSQPRSKRSWYHILPSAVAEIIGITEIADTTEVKAVVIEPSFSAVTAPRCRNVPQQQETESTPQLPKGKAVRFDEMRRRYPISTREV